MSYHNHAQFERALRQSDEMRQNDEMRAGKSALDPRERLARHGPIRSAPVPQSWIERILFS